MKGLLSDCSKSNKSGGSFRFHLWRPTNLKLASTDLPVFDHPDGTKKRKKGLLTTILGLDNGYTHATVERCFMERRELKQSK